MSEMLAKRRGRAGLLDVVGRVEAGLHWTLSVEMVGQTKHAGTCVGWGQFLVAGSSLAGRGLPSLCFLAC